MKSGPGPDVGINDRLFAPPAADLSKIEARLARLPAPVADWIRRAGDALVTDDVQSAQHLLANALSAVPGQPDGLRLYGLLLAKIGNFTAAFANLDSALRAAPDDALGYWQYAQLREQAGEDGAALRLREQAAQQIPESPLAWADLGEYWLRRQQPERALEPLVRATRLAPDYAPAHLKLGDALIACGRVAEGAAAMRRAIAAEPGFAAAWMDLVDLKTVPVTDSETEQMQRLIAGGGIDEAERTAIGFALGRAHEDAGRADEAYRVLVAANARRKRELPAWDAAAFAARVRRAAEVFAAPYAVADDAAFGSPALFIVGLPRSGTTLVEQILSSHPQVQGLGELGALAQVLTEGSAQRQQRYPDWVPAATAVDWRRLGERYLELVGPLRDGRPRFTDKMPNNWQAIGAIRAMLPGAKIVACLRDPLENCWSCYKQYFEHGWEFTCDQAHLAGFWRAYESTATAWAERDPAAVLVFDHDALVRAPDDEIPKLLAFCGLPFDPACLAPHLNQRRVDTLSAFQVQQPLRAPAAKTPMYGELLDPLRVALGLPPMGTRAASR